MRRSHRLTLAAALTSLAALAASSVAGAALNPGGLTPLNETVDVNVVFVGTFGGADPSWSAVAAGLPTTGSPKTRSQAALRARRARRELGITYNVHVHERRTRRHRGRARSSRYLTSIAQAKPRTLFQDEYNAQAGALDVGQNHWIDAPSVEKWLIEQPAGRRRLTKPTIFFVNWKDAARPFNVPRLHEDRTSRIPTRATTSALVRETRKIVAWGGTAPDDEETGYGGLDRKRVWFYDLSAGPESWGGSFDVTNADIDGDGVARLPDPEHLGVLGHAARVQPSRASARPPLDRPT